MLLPEKTEHKKLEEALQRLQDAPLTGTISEMKVTISIDLVEQIKTLLTNYTHRLPRIKSIPPVQQTPYERAAGHRGERVFPGELTISVSEMGTEYIAKPVCSSTYDFLQDEFDTPKTKSTRNA